MKTGKVWLVGAGPGDIGLFTLKGLKVLEQADVVVYDSLVGQGVLSRIPENARLINVGKRASHHIMRQENINQVLLEEAQKGLRVVRLKGGDPFLFGRGGEELELLRENGIPYEVVPGVTSSIAVPAYNGVPVTHRDFCSSVHIITGHKRAGEEYDIDFRALVETKGTLVFLMGVSALPDICEGLIGAGMEKDMPAAILQKGTTAGQKRIVATVSTLEEEVKRQGIETPAIIVVGKVCTLAEKFGWYEELPLSGWKVLVTRPKELVSRTADMLREKGAEVLELPAIRTVPMEDQSRLYKALDHLEEYQWLVFTSPTGVRVFFEELIRHGKDIRAMGNARLAVIGEGTKKALKERGLLAEKGNEKLTAFLAQAGAVVEDVPTYQTLYEKSQLIDEKKEFETGQISCAVFTSASTVKGFVEGTKGLDYSKVKAACIGRQTKAAAESFGMKAYMSEKATIDSLVKLVEDMKRSE